MMKVTTILFTMIFINIYRKQLQFTRIFSGALCSRRCHFWISEREFREDVTSEFTPGDERTFDNINQGVHSGMPKSTFSDSVSCASVVPTMNDVRLRMESRGILVGVRLSCEGENGVLRCENWSSTEGPLVNNPVVFDLEVRRCPTPTKPPPIHFLCSGGGRIEKGWRLLISLGKRWRG